MDTNLTEFINRNFRVQKNLTRVKVFVIGFSMLYSSGAFAQVAGATDLRPGYYVVVASYLGGQDAYAQAFVTKANQEGKHTAFGFDPVRKFLHVYIDKYTDFNESVHQMLRARREGYPTAWVRIIKGNMQQSPEQKISAPEVVAKNEKPATVPAIPVTPSATAKAPVVAAAPPASEKTSSPPPSAAIPAPPSVTITETPPKEEMPVVTNNEATFNLALLHDATVLLTLYNPTNNTGIEGAVEIVDAEKSKLLEKAKSNDLVLLPDPKSKSGKLLLIATSFGYRPAQHELNYKSTEKDTLPNFIDVLDNHYRIRFDMVRLRRGDITVLYNVYFYNDAAIMLPDSKYELNKLFQLLKDNPGYRIKLHGHTNGNGSGKIITMGKSKDFFTLNSETSSSFGSAKELSRDRAQVIKDWLISNGIDGHRIEVQAHGGSRMLHDKNSANAKKNVRVEVEMLSE